MLPKGTMLVPTCALLCYTYIMLFSGSYTSGFWREVFDVFCGAWLTVCDDISSRGCANVIWREWGAVCIRGADLNWRYCARHKQATERCPLRDSEDQIICASSKVLHQVFWCQGRIQSLLLILTLKIDCVKRDLGACGLMQTITSRTVFHLSQSPARAPFLSQCWWHVVNLGITPNEEGWPP